MRYYLAVLASLLLTCAVFAEDSAFDKELVKCVNEAGLKIEDLNSEIINKDIKAGCAVACAMKKAGMMVDGKLDKDVIISSMDSEKYDDSGYEKIKQNMAQCYDEVSNGEDIPECDLAGKFAYCLYTKGN